MIIDLDRFVKNERPAWNRLDQIVTRMRTHPERPMSLDEVRELHALYERACSGLARISNSVHGGQLREYLESLVAGAYAEIHDNREVVSTLTISSMVQGLVHYLTETLPATFRRRIMAFYISTALFMLGAVFGAIMLAVEPEAKGILIPGGFSHLDVTPTQRVQQEEADGGMRRSTSEMTKMTAFYWTNNIRVGLVTASMGMLWGVGTVISLIFNGVLLGIVSADFIADGQGVFLMGWLL
ncbi:MAG: stage II sporulation protein M, partial [Candidatus Methylacidiphilales bacterium]